VSSNAEAVKNRQAMAVGWFTVVPASFIMDMGSAMPVRVLGVTNEEMTALQKINPGFIPYTLKAGIYKDQGVTEAVQTFQSPTVLIASSKTSPDVIYKITKAIVEEREEFGNVTSVMKGVTAAEMAENFGMPMHPGAEKYYREAGLLKK
jgi:TRAP transporter TAXI family solute receptor